MQAKIGCPYLSDLPYYKRAVWFEMKRLCLSDYPKKQTLLPLVRASPAISILKPTGSTLTTTDTLWKPTTVSMNFHRKEVCACGGRHEGVYR